MKTSTAVSSTTAAFPSSRSVFILAFVIISVISTVNANWYGKRADKVDDTLYQLLEGNVPNVQNLIDRQLDAQMTLRAISKLISEYQLRQLQHSDVKGGQR